MSLLPAGRTLRIGLKTKSTIGLITANATTTPTPTAIAELMMRFRTCSSCSSTENLNREGRSGSSEPNRPAVTATTTFYLSLPVGGAGDGANAREREFRDMRGHLDRIIIPGLRLRPEAGGNRVRHEEHPLGVNARHALKHTRVVRRAAENLGDDGRQIVEPRADALLDEGVEGRRGVV